MRKYLLLGFVLCIGYLSYAQKAVNFKLNPEIGKPLTIKMLMKTDVDGPQSVIMSMNMLILMTPLRVEEGNFVIENITKTIQVDVDAGMMIVGYNSMVEPTNEMEKMMSEQFSKIIGQPIISTLSPKGKAIHVEIPENIQEDMDKIPFSNIITELPEQAIAPGTSWSGSMASDNHPLLARTETTSTFREETAEGYVIDVVGKLLDTADNELGNFVGSYTLDKKTHFTKLAKVKTTIELEESKVITSYELEIN